MLNNLKKKKIRENKIAWIYDGLNGCHMAHEECRSTLLECRMAPSHTTTLTLWWADSSHFSNARFVFSHF